MRRSEEQLTESSWILWFSSSRMKERSFSLEGDLCGKSVFFLLVCLSLQHLMCFAERLEDRETFEWD